MIGVPTFQVKTTPIKGLLEIGRIPHPFPRGLEDIPNKLRDSGLFRRNLADINLWYLATYLGHCYDDCSYTTSKFNKETRYWHTDLDRIGNNTTHSMLLMVSHHSKATRFLRTDRKIFGRVFRAKSNTIYLVPHDLLHRSPRFSFGIRSIHRVVLR
jgi:hypothetical protein